MKKSILNLGNTINKAEQKNINGGYGNSCDSYYGPSYYDLNNCEAYHALPSHHQKCAKVHHLCFGF